MRDPTYISDDFTNDIKGLKAVHDRTPAMLRDWPKPLAVVLGVTRRDIANLIRGQQGQRRQTEETTSTGLSPVVAGFDRANEDP